MTSIWEEPYSKLFPNSSTTYNNRQPVSERVKIVGRRGFEQRPAVVYLKQDPGHF